MDSDTTTGLAIVAIAAIGLMCLPPRIRERIIAIASLFVFPPYFFWWRFRRRRD